MKKIIVFLLFVILSYFGNSQNVGISDDNSFTPIYLLHVKPQNTYVNDLFSVQLNAGTFFHVTNSGKSAFGTTTPNTLVDIVGGSSGVHTTLLTLRSNFVADGTSTGLKLINSTSLSSVAGSEIISQCIVSANGRNDLIFKVHGGGGVAGALNERMRVLGNGQVIVGNSTPYATDDVLIGYASSVSLAWGIAGYHIGTDGGGGFFQITGATNGYNAGESWTNGTGMAFLAATTNVANNMIGIWAQTSAANGRYGLYSPNRCLSLQWLVISDSTLKQNIQRMLKTYL